MFHYLGIIICSILAYLIGSLSWSITIVRWRRGIDIRTVGSGNAGATNTFRVLGPAWGISVVALDALKVPFAALIAVCFSLIPNSLFSETSYLIPAVMVLVGHCWPVYYGFKGGKAVACFIGLLFVTNIWYLFIFLIVWWLVVAITRKVSVASIVAVATVIILVWFPWLNGIDTFAWKWNSAADFYRPGNYTWGWQSNWLRFDWLNYLHQAAFNYTVHAGNGLELHGVRIKDVLDSSNHLMNVAGKISFDPSLNGNGIRHLGYGVRDAVNASGFKFNIGFAEGMLQYAIVLVSAILLILLRHIPNMKRMAEHKEPDTFPKMTPEERAQLRTLQHQPMPSMDERRKLKALEDKAKLEKKQKAVEERIARINQEIAEREAKYAKKKKAKADRKAARNK